MTIDPSRLQQIRNRVKAYKDAKFFGGSLGPEWSGFAPMAALLYSNAPTDLETLLAAYDAQQQEIEDLRGIARGLQDVVQGRVKSLAEIDARLVGSGGPVSPDPSPELSVSGVDPVHGEYQITKRFAAKRTPPETEP